MAIKIEKKQSTNTNARTAFLLATVFNVSMLGLFRYITVWNAEENLLTEPVGGQGFVVNFGTDAKGSGEVYTKNHASNTRVAIDTKPSEVAESAKPADAKATRKPDPNNTRISEKSAEANVITSTKPSAVKITEKKDTKLAPENKTGKTPTVTPKKETILNGSLLPSRAKNTPNGTTGNSNAGGGADGDDNVKGNKGQSNGNTVKGGTYERRPVGTGGQGKGGSGGSSYSLAGWVWNGEPRVDDDTDESGTLTFKIKVDSDGIVRSAVPTERGNFSPSVIEKYKKAVMKISFRPVASSGDMPPLSVGSVTFQIVTN